MNRLLGLPILASEHGAEIDRIIVDIHILMLVAFILWGAFFIVPLIRYRKSKQPKAKYLGLQSSIPYILVAGMAIGETFLLVALSLPFWDEHVAAGPPEDVDVFEIRVVAQQYAWNIHYPGPDGIFGRTDNALVDDAVANYIGFDPDDPAGKDDVHLQAVLHVPLGRTVQVHLTSRDVIHSFFLPEFRVKQDVIPGMSMSTHFVPTMTTQELRDVTKNESRRFEIVCAQLCGLGHYRMRGFMTVETQEEFDAWYATELEYKALYEQ